MEYRKPALIPCPRTVRMTGAVCAKAQEPETEERPDMGEGYILEIGEDGIRIAGGSAGIFYGKVTLAQLRRQYQGELPGMVIEDSPRYAYRGFMLDSSRHFIPAGDICRLLEAAAYFKLNRMHWHLIDDQGWRVEIEKYPELTRTGAKRGKAHFGNFPEPECSEGYYTGKEIRDIVSYASSLHIEIIPEIEIPGHETAAIASYPWLGCSREQVEVETRGGIFDRLLCAGRQETYGFLFDVLDELIGLFPSPLIHIGGDEAVKRQWRRCPDCQRKMRELGLANEHRLQQWMVLQAGDYLKKHGKRPVVWNESLRGDLLPTDYMVQYWCHDHALVLDFLKRGGQAVWSLNETMYFDYPYGRISVEDILNTRTQICGEDVSDRLAGMECTLWSERIPDMERAARLLFPRLPAMAERAWSREIRTAAEFFRDYRTVKEWLEEKGLHGAPESCWQMDEKAREAELAAERALQDTPENRIQEEYCRELVDEDNRIYGTSD